ncbi:MAG: Uma2 family endonuclease [Pseudomonadota bacterium]|nr:Uma2 family endonuclease [Pseudomonadota bacterium]
MNTLLRTRRYTFEQWLALEETASVRHELAGGELLAMGGGTDLHNLIALGLRDALRQGLGARRCRVYVADVKLKVGEDGYYPDVMVSCSEADSHRLYKTEPVLVAEVLSDTSVHRDRVTKLNAYRQLPSLKAYLILSQEAPRIEAYLPAADGWERFEYGIDDTVVIASLGLSVPVRAVYAEVLGELGYAAG